MRKDLVFGNERRRRILADHVAGVDAAVGREERGQAVTERGVYHALHAALGNVGEFGCRDGQIIHHERDRLAVEVAARNDAFVVQKQDRVVGDGVELGFEHLAHMRKRVAHRAMYLRNAAQRVGVLHAQVPVSLHRRAVFAERAHVLRRKTLPVVRAHRVDARIERGKKSGQRLHRQRRGDVRKLRRAVQIVPRERADRRHALGAVDQRQTFLCKQVERRKLRLCHRLRAAHALSLIDRFAASEQHQRHVRERGEVARGAQRTLLGDDRMHALVQHADQRFDQRSANAGIALRKRVCAQQHHGADGFFAERFADGDAVRQDQIFLKLRALVARNRDLRELAEAGRNAVDGPAFTDDLVHQRARRVDARKGARRKGDFCAETGDGDDLFDLQGFPVEGDVTNVFRKMVHTRSFLFQTLVSN